MFIQKRPDPAAARKELYSNLRYFATAVLLIRASTYVMDLIQQLCGIFGYYNYRLAKSRGEVIEVLLTGLRRLEYRGYDSAGLAIDTAPILAPAADENDPTLAAHPNPPLVLKSRGKIASLASLARRELTDRNLNEDTQYETHAGIAHTRWATHGPPSAVNAHPHVSDPQGEFVVVHNGIITNFQALKDFLMHHGETFESETDTEVIPKLLKWVYRGLSTAMPFSQLVMDVMSHLEGAYALLIKSTHYPGELVACKRGSPLILGVRTPTGSGPVAVGGLDTADGISGGHHLSGMEYFLASDASAVVEHTKRVLVLEEGDVVALRHGAYEIFSYNRHNSRAGVPQTRALETLNMEVSSIMKGGYDHFMQKEIFEQPETILQTMRGRVRFDPGDVAGLAERTGSPVAWTQSFQQDAASANQSSSKIKLGGLAEHLPAIRASRRMVLVACGTSFHACLAARKAIESLAGLPVGLELASDLLDRTPPLFRDDTCVFVSQSGETADTLRALEYAKRCGALCVGVTNTVGSAIARSTDCGIHINAGCEIGVASTKAYTSQIVALIMMALALSEDSVSRAGQREAVITGLGQLPHALRTALQLDREVRQVAAFMKDEHSLLVFGRGFNYATALEAALKVKEVALMHSEGILAGEMKHGPLALVDENMPVLVVATKDAMHAKMMSVIQQLRARGARLIVLCCGGDSEVEAAAGREATLVRVPWVPDCLQPIVNAVPLQLLAYHLAVLRGHDVDQPRNLAKSVTVTEEDGSGAISNGQGFGLVVGAC